MGNGGNSDRSTPVQISSVPGGRTAVAVVAGDVFGAALANDGTVWGWGTGGNGEFGNGTTGSAGFSATPVQANALPGGRITTAIASGYYHVLAQANDGTLWAWGYNVFGQLGNGGTVNKSIPTQVNALPSGRTAIAIGAGAYHSLAVANDGTVWAWGRGDFGQLGNGATANSSVPVLVNALPGGRTAVRVVGSGGVSGASHSLAVANDGTAWAWGPGALGQLGRGSTAASLIPVQVNPLPGGRTFVSIAAGGSHSLAVANDGTAWAWGNNGNGQLGDGTVTLRTSPIQVTSLSGGRTFVGIAGGASYSLAYANDGTVWTWGFGSNGQLGNGSTADSRTPVQATGILVGHKAIAVGAGVNTSLAAVQDNSLPVASCQNVIVSAGAGCTANASIDNGSNDPDSGDTITLTQSPAGPYPLGPTVVTLTVTDSHGATASCSATVTVQDTTAPVPNLTSLPDATGQCSASIATAPTAADNCGGTITGTTSDSLTRTTQGTSTVTWTFNDGHGNTSSQTQNIVVHDTTAPVPVLASLPDATGQCSATITAAPTATDNCAGTITGTTSDSLTRTTQGTSSVTWTFDDGYGNTSSQTQNIVVQDTTAPVPVLASLPDATGQCSATIATAPTATDNCDGTITGTTSDSLTRTTQGTSTVTWTFNDGHGNTSSQTQNIVVQDTTAPVPVLASLPDATGQCSATIATAPTATDNCGGTITGTTGDSLTRSTQGTSTVTWTFDDGHGNTSSQTQNIVVQDTTAPMATCPASASIGSCTGVVPDIISSVIASDNCTATTALTITQDPAAGTAIGAGINSIAVTVTDEAGNSTSCSTSLVAADDAPVIASIVGPTGPIALGSASSITVNFDDPDTQNAVTIAWDDGVTSALTAASGATSLGTTHTYTATGVYTVGVTVTDPCGSIVSATYQFIVIYDPEGGFVTGGGSIISPPGAYVANSDLTGKATFGFESKYKKGAQLPTGNTHFQFHVAGFTFKSTAYEWLVVSGAKAQYKGVGTVNGSGTFKFRLTATDGQAPGGGGVDKFRLKITTAGDGLVYDNVPGASDDMDQANPQTINNGNIVIHK